MLKWIQTAFMTGRPRVAKSSPQGSWTRIGHQAVVGEHVTLGHWTRIGHRSVVENHVTLGQWAQIGTDCRVGQGSIFGDHAQIGDNVVLGKNVVLGTHTRIRGPLVVPDGTTFGDQDLVTPEGIVPNRISGYIMGKTAEQATVSGAFGRFVIPGPHDVHGRRSDGDEPCAIRDMIKNHFWGLNEDLERHRVAMGSQETPSSPS